MLFIPKALSNMGAGNIALKIGAQGVCKSVTTACASANDAIGEAFISRTDTDMLGW